MENEKSPKKIGRKLAIEYYTKKKEEKASKEKWFNEAMFCVDVFIGLRLGMKLVNKIEALKKGNNNYGDKTK